MALSKFEDEYALMEFEDDYGNDRIQYVIKCKDNVDIICYAHANTLQEVIDSFDHNINQYVLAAGEPVFKGQDEFTLKRLRLDVKAERQIRMRELAKDWNEV